jgi:hypothetical protein
MAIISIPSSIGGVSIPGNLLKGPLAKLFNVGGITSLQYPRDLGSSTRGHTVQFTILEVKPIGYEQGKDYSLKNIGNAIGQTASDISSAAEKAYDASTGAVDTGFNVVGAVFGSINEKISNRLKDRTTEIKAAITLYMPETLSFTNQASYTDTTLLDIAQEALQSLGTLGADKDSGLMRKIAGAIPGSINTGISAVRSNAGKLLLSTQGLAINPQNQLLFDGIGFRNYSMSFTFTPYSKEEANSVKEIIKMFKMHAAPRLVSGAGGMLFIPPSSFKLDFFFNGKRNENIGKVAESVIESIEVNYAPNGWSAHTDGAPVQTTMTISFKEIEIIDRAKIEKNGF